jgi:tRNA dimethylallyltransferase
MAMDVMLTDSGAGGVAGEDATAVGEVFYFTGPTGAGKSALAMQVAADCGAEIVNADAFQLYRGLEILTAAPSALDRAKVPHHLFGVLEVGETCDAARYAAMARRVLAELAARGVPAFVVGGSGLYIKALTHGLSDLPSDETVRAALAGRPLEEKIEQLRELDPVGAETMNLANPRYVDRALEICLLTGRPASEGRSAWRGPDPEGLYGVMLTWEREELYRRIDRRVVAMFEAGVVDEVAALAGSAEAGGGRAVSLTVEKAIGWREISAYLAGTLSRDEVVAAMQLATRRYAKRQLTWFRREKWLKTVCLDADATPDLMAASILHAFFS